MELELRFTFPASSMAERSKLATSLEGDLHDKGLKSTQVLRERPDTQDPGTILSIVLGAPAVVFAVKAIAAWMIRNNQTNLTIERPDGTVVLRNSEAIKALEGLFRQK